MSKKVLAKIAAIETALTRLSQTVAAIRTIAQAEADKADGSSVTGAKKVSAVAKKVTAVAAAAEKAGKKVVAKAPAAKKEVKAAAAHTASKKQKKSAASAS